MRRDRLESRVVLVLTIMVTIATASALAAQAASPSPSDTTIAPGEPWIVYQSSPTTASMSRIHVVRPDGRDDHALLPADTAGDEQTHPAWSPDGAWVAFEQRLYGVPDQVVLEPQFDFTAEIWVADVATGKADRLASCSLPCLQLAYPAWSPDGRSIAISRYDIRPDGRWGQSAIETIDVASGARSVVSETADGTTAYYTPRWSPDGSRIVAVLESYPDEHEAELTASDLVILSADGTQPPDVLDLGSFAREPDWAPGPSIIFLATPDADYAGTIPELQSIEPGQDKPVTILPSTRSAEPVWEPGAQSIQLTVWREDGTSSLFHVRPDGTHFEVDGWYLKTPTDGPQRAHAHPRP